eukprot:1237757-Prymnesium_polylepis.2
MSAQMPKGGALGEKSSLYLQDTSPIPRPYKPLDTMDRITAAARPSSSGISAMEVGLSCLLAAAQR